MPQTLLPSGLRDLLPPEAAHQRCMVSGLLERFARFGYAEVNPPLLEFEENIGSNTPPSTGQPFRVQDPLSHRVLEARTDMTGQIARIAADRLGGESLPLRLCYSGTVLRAAPEGLSAERQMVQAGLELVGSDAIQATAEVITAMIEALQQIGFNTLVLDLSLGGLLAEILGEAPQSGADAAAISRAVQHKDVSALPDSLSQRDVIASLLECGGDAASVISHMETLDLPDRAVTRSKELAELLACLPRFPGVTITADPLDARRMQYDRGVGFSLFLPEAQEEIGLGGCYEIARGTEDTLPAVGGTLYISRLLAHYTPSENTATHHTLPVDTPYEDAVALRNTGDVTVMELDE